MYKQSVKLCSRYTKIFVDNIRHQKTLYNYKDYIQFDTLLSFSLLIITQDQNNLNLIPKLKQILTFKILAILCYYTNLQFIVKKKIKLK